MLLFKPPQLLYLQMWECNLRPSLLDNWINDMCGRIEVITDLNEKWRQFKIVSEYDQEIPQTQTMNDCQV